MRIVCISDTHGLHDQLTLPPGDVVVHSGDFTERGEDYEIAAFLKWFAAQPHQNKILVAGNHDRYAEDCVENFKLELKGTGITYLDDSGAKIMGKRFWGSPVTPLFHHMAFNRYRGADIRWHWEKIPKVTEVLITHGPPAGVLDFNGIGRREGCEDLLEVVEKKLTRLKLHVFGHIHPPGGQILERNGVRFVNAAICDGRNYLQQRPVVIDL